MPRLSSWISTWGTVKEESEWSVGGLYRVRGGYGSRVAVWRGPDLDGSGPVCELQAWDSVLLLRFQEAVSADGEPVAGSIAGLVVPPFPKRPGWIALQDPTDMSRSPLVRQRLEGSWEMRARYKVRNPATVRLGPELSSDWIYEAQPSEEVLALELSCCYEDGSARLRMMVSMDSGVIGWLSPETAHRDRLLHPVNLLSPKILDLHRRSLSAKRRRTWQDHFLSSGRRSPSWAGRHGEDGMDTRSPGPPRSWRHGGPCPWLVGGQYRVLERTVMRESAELTSAELGRISAGTIATIVSLQSVLETSLLAEVTIQDGLMAGRQGWIRCTSSDGYDLLDTRDQLEFDQLHYKLQILGSEGWVQGLPADVGAAAGNQDPDINIPTGAPQSQGSPDSAFVLGFRVKEDVGTERAFSSPSTTASGSAGGAERTWSSPSTTASGSAGGAERTWSSPSTTASGSARLRSLGSHDLSPSTSSAEALPSSAEAMLVLRL